MPATEQPRKTTTERKLEKIHGKPMPELLRDKLEECGTVKGAAEALDVSTRTCSAWLEKWGLDVKRTTVVVPQPPVPA